LKRNPKIYYVPGMISLIILPLWAYFYLNPFNKIERCKEIVLCSKYDPNACGTIRFDTTFLSRPKTKRNYLTIKLTGNKPEDKIKLDFYRLRIRELLNENDSINGVHLLFLDSVKYSIFIKALDIIEEEGMVYYIVFENNLWCFYMKVEKATFDRIKKRREERKESMKAENIKINIDNSTFKDRLNDVVKVWPIFIGLILLSFFSIRRMIRTNDKTIDK
jgi:hypothetical protein